MAARWPFLGSVALAEAHERGDRRETMWLHLSENHYADPVLARLHAFSTLASREPRLRALHPRLSVLTLSFRPTADRRNGPRLPAVIPTPTPDRFTVRTSTHIHDECTAPTALHLVLTDLPT
ncbi:DUF6193 family natural product biosynthesis protein [Actinoplanes awajinensis]|uniref:Uncharacterized protein n=1 Tax=Actinoplanes awajinensis subsp. mycoplanecinus TaxID=135947 RepID=A0A101JL73_9ACTN|nr:DUF6193 family natural product biosynthesis protein [Actinoplanes awajinensis]KUL28940.1 hypothetical protein ADL15_30315 [Actinoplanes awajinensis subsp. mycoplanecinus]